MDNIILASKVIAKIQLMEDDILLAIELLTRNLSQEALNVAIFTLQKRKEINIFVEKGSKEPTPNNLNTFYSEMTFKQPIDSESLSSLKPLSESKNSHNKQDDLNENSHSEDKEKTSLNEISPNKESEHEISEHASPAIVPVDKHEVLSETSGQVKSIIEPPESKRMDEIIKYLMEKNYKASFLHTNTDQDIFYFNDKEYILSKTQVNALGGNMDPKIYMSYDDKICTWIGYVKDVINE